jgi:hypothetical protein
LDVEDAQMADKKRTVDPGQIAETTLHEDDSLATGDIADAWLEEFSEEPTWGDLTRWLSEVG